MKKTKNQGIIIKGGHVSSNNMVAGKNAKIEINKSEAFEKTNQTKKELENFSKKLENLIKEGNIQTAIEFLIKTYRSQGNEKKLNDILLISSRYNFVQTQYAKGIILDKEWINGNSVITNSILTLFKQ